MASILATVSEMAANIAPREIFVGIVGFSWVTFLWEEYLARRQVNIVLKENFKWISILSFCISAIIVFQVFRFI